MLALAVFVGFCCLSASITSSQKCEELGDVAVVLDSSSEVDFETWDGMIRLVQEVIYQMTINAKLTRIAVVVYGNSAKLIFPFNRYFTAEEVAMAVGKLSYDPFMLANLTAALTFLESSVFTEVNGARDHAPDAALIITASQPNVQRVKVFSTASRLRRAGVRLFAVAIDGRVDRVELRAIATNPDEDHFFYTPGPKTLPSLTNPIAKNLCRDLKLCTDAADLVFILDCSGSVKEPWRRSLEFARDLVDLLPVGEYNVRVAAVAYSNYAYRQFTFNTAYTRAGIKALIDGIQYHDKNTNTSGALRMTRKEMFKTEFGDRPSVRDVGVLITDGRATWEAENLAEESREMHRAGIQMYAIGLGPSVDVGELNMIGSDPDIAHVFMLEMAEDYVTDAIVLKWSDCEIDVTYCSKFIDLVFVLDQSGSVGEANFKRMLNFVRTLTGVLEVDAGTARVGVLLFGDRGKVLFHLNEYELGEEAARAILEVEYGRGTTNTAEALQMVRELMFTPDKGDRPDVPNFVIVITDGASDNFGATLKEAKALKEIGATVLALGIGDPAWLRHSELRAMASLPRDMNTLQATSFQSLDSVVQAMQDATCNETNECIGDPCKNGGVCRNGTNMYTCECPESYAGRDCQIECPQFYDLVLAIDASGSVGETNFYKMLDFFTDFIGDLPFHPDPDKSTRVGILTYSDEAEVEQHLDRYLDRRMIQEAIYTPYRQGTTNTAAAIRSIRENMFVESNGDRPLVPNVAILITDGKSTDREATWREAVKARQAGIHLVVIGVTRGVSDLELRGIASGPDDRNVYRVPNFASLGQLREGLATSLCNAVNECDNNRCQNGASCLDGINTYYCVCQPGFVGENCERRSSQAMDLVFLLDTSGSIQRENFPKLIAFAKAIVNNLNVGSEAVRVAAITFSTGAKVEFTLGEYVTKYDVMHALERIRYDPGTTNTAEALKLLRETVFSGEEGDRLDTFNYAVIVTDGNPDDLDLTVDEAVDCRIHGIRIVVVGIGMNGQRALEYRAIASYPVKKTVWSVKSVSRLSTLVEAVTDSIVDDRDYCTDVNCNAGRCQSMFLSYMCDCPAPLTGIHCDRRCNRQMDLALVVDVSAESKDFPLMLDFLRSLVLSLSFKFGNVRVSLVCFDHEVKTLFSLTDYTSSLEVLEAITLPKRGSGTDISRALYTLRDEVFRPDKGDRTGVPNYAILLSDGQDSEPPRVDVGDITIFTIGIGRNVNRFVLNAVAARPEDSPMYQRIETEKDVSRVLDWLLEHLCT